MSNWLESSLLQLVTFQKGRKVETSKFPHEGLDLHLGASGIEGRDDGYASTQHAVVAGPNDILMLWDGERSGLVGHGRSGVVGSTVCKLTPNGAINSKYLYYSLLEKFDWIQNRRTGTGVPHVPKDLGRVLIIRYPQHLHQQRKVTLILSTIDDAIVKNEAFIKKYQKIKLGLMHDLFTRGVLLSGQLRPSRRDAPELYHQTETGWIPAEWKVEPTGMLCEMSSGGTPSRSEPSYWDGSIPWVKTGEIKYETIYKTEEYITQHGLDSSSAKIFPEGTLVMAMYGEGVTRGRVAILGTACASNQACIGFYFNDKVLSQYMYYFFEYSYYALRDLSNDGSQKNLSSSVLKQFATIYPINRLEQCLISDRLLAIDGLIEKESIQLDILHNQKLGLMQDLLTGKVEVKLNGSEDVKV